MTARKVAPWFTDRIPTSVRRCPACDEPMKVGAIERGKSHVVVHFRCRAGCDVRWTETTEPDPTDLEDS